MTVAVRRGSAGEQLHFETRSLFATPLAVVLLPEAPSLNPRLRRLILDLHAGAPTDEGAWQSDWQAGTAAPGALRPLFDAAGELATAMTRDRDDHPATPDWRLTWRCSLLCQGQSMEIHAHPGELWSATYFVDDGGNAGTKGLGGVYEFQDPRGAAPVMYAPHLTFAFPGGAGLGVTQTLTPKAGALIVHPGWLLHGVAHYRGKGQRISISMNLTAKDPA